MTNPKRPLELAREILNLDPAIFSGSQTMQDSRTLAAALERAVEDIERAKDGLRNVIVHTAHLPEADPALLAELLKSCNRISRAILRELGESHEGQS